MSEPIAFFSRWQRGGRPTGRNHLASGKARGRIHPPPLLRARTRLQTRWQLPRVHGGGRGRARAGGIVSTRAHAGMKVHSHTARAQAARAWSWSCCLADQPERSVAHDPQSRLWQWADEMGIEQSRVPSFAAPAPDPSHPAMRVHLDACIHCNLCVRACREVQVNDVIGMAYRGHGSKIVFDFDDPMGMQHLCRLRRVRASVSHGGAHGGDAGR